MRMNILKIENRSKLVKKVLAGALLLLAVGFAGMDVSAYPIQTTESTSKNFYWSGDSHNYNYASCVDFFEKRSDGLSAGAWIGTQNGLSSLLSWKHTLPADLQVPPDIIKRARLWIDGYAIDSDNNCVKIGSSWNWDPLEESNWKQDNSTYNLTNTNIPGFWNNGTLGVTVKAGERSIRIDRAILMIDYVNVDGDPRSPGGAIPEPATISLLGLGLLGMGIVSRRKK